MIDIIPAIDLIGGRCVRLIQGRYDRQITYKDHPAEQAAEFADVGARRLHVVDLEGAKAGRPVNTAAIAAIIGLGRLKVEVGGGLRDESSIAELLDMGVDRVIIGTRAVQDFDWFSEMTKQFPGRIVLGIDARGANVATHGWLQDSPLTVLEFAARADPLPLAAIIYTDISKDGMLCGPNIERTAELAAAVKAPVVASGGVHTIDDIRRLLDTSVAAAIAGRSLYEGTLDLAEALAVAQGGRHS